MRRGEHAMNAFDKIAGYEKEKEELQNLVEIFNHRKKYELKGATLPKGIIFYGEAGTGKSLFAEILARECLLCNIKIDLSESASEKDICKQIRTAFLKGSGSKKPTMIFFDELDKLLPNEDEEYYTDRSKTILAQLLTLIDGMDKSNKIVFVATCNNYHALPSSITRAGRFDKKIHLGLPDQSSRTAILHMYMNASPAKFALSAESISRLCVGFSCAALKTLINECLLQSDENNSVCEDLIRRKITEIKEEDIPTERSNQFYMVNAVRNIGSFIASRLYSNSGYVLNVEDSTVCNSFLNKIIWETDEDEYDYEDEYVDDYAEKKRTSETFFCKNDYLATVTALLAGYAAEELYFKKVYNNLRVNLGLVDDILLKISNCGMLGLDLFSTDMEYRDIPYPKEHIERLHHTFEEIKQSCYQKARSIVEKNETLLKRLVPMLIERKSMEKPECEALILELGGIRT